MIRVPTGTRAIAGPGFMRRMLVTVTAVAVSVVGGPLLSGASAAQKRGTSYADETSGGHVALMFSSDGTQVRRAFVAYTYDCSDNEDFADFERFKSLSVSSSRKFKSSYDSGPLPSTIIPGVQIQFTGSLKGRRSASGRKVSGTFRFTFVTTVVATGAKVTCDTGKISYSAKD